MYVLISAMTRFGILSIKRNFSTVFSIVLLYTENESSFKLRSLNPQSFCEHQASISELDKLCTRELYELENSSIFHSVRRNRFRWRTYSVEEYKISLLLPANARIRLEIWQKCIRVSILRSRPKFNTKEKFNFFCTTHVGIKVFEKKKKLRVYYWLRWHTEHGDNLWPRIYECSWAHFYVDFSPITVRKYRQ